VETVDRFFRDPKTVVSGVIAKLSPRKGTEYLHSLTKGALDVAVGYPAVVVAAPVILGSALAVVVEDGGPPFFVQRRVGKDPGTCLDVIKVRSMKKGSDNGIDSIAIASGRRAEEDPRNTRVGCFLRKYNLDELPQLFQVLLGQISLVGIRPLPEYAFNHMKKVLCEKEYAEWVECYHRGKLGITGLAQTFGDGKKVDDKRNHFDVFYAKNASLGLDLYLLWRTLKQVLLSR
jgi:lipopolysaccharide/colanic/teichoic acid biosynthesis glycosyltransferase